MNSVPIQPADRALVAALMPRHGTVSVQPARQWEDALAAGNGIMGALLYGDPQHDTLIVDHCKLWLPLGSREFVPDVGQSLPEMRGVIGQKGYGAGQQFFLDKARQQGWSGHLVWTDPFHPGYFLNIDQPAAGPVTNYARVEDFSTGEVRTQWHTAEGDFGRRLFVSRPDNVIALEITGPRHKIGCTITMQKVENESISSTIVHEADHISCHNVYLKGKGGYDGIVRVIARGGKQTTDGRSIHVDGADSLLLLTRIQPWKIPLPDSQSWPYSAKNPDFSHPGQLAGLYRAASAYHPQWMDDTNRELASLPADYTRLFRSHAAAWRKIYNRVTIDLGGSAAERAMCSEALLDLAQKEHRMPNALLERMYDAGRYVFLCSAGPETPPNLFGIWTGTWQPAWSGDYTTDTNLQLDVECAYSGNMAEAMQGYFNLWDSYLPEFRTNAHNLYGCRGIMTGSRASNLGLNLHWDGGWPGELWTVGASWIARWYYDYYQYTGDRKFLRERAIPFMKECALFWEDFLKGTEDSTGHYTFRPSFSAENGWGDNSSQDIEITQQLLTSLINGCQTLGVEPEGVQRWKEMLAKLPPLLINEEGQLKEWSNPTQGENNNHRHLMHLYGAFDGEEFSEEQDPKLFAAARVALMNRVNASTEDATHGFMHTGLAAAALDLGNVAYARVEELAKRRSVYPSMVDGHFGGPRVLCDDGNGATPEIVNRMIIQSSMGRLALLPALPDALPRGVLTGTRARGAILVNRIAWDIPAGSLSAVLTSDETQSLSLALPSGAIVESILIDRKPTPITNQGVRKEGCLLTLHKGKPTAIVAHFHFSAAPSS